MLDGILRASDICKKLDKKTIGGDDVIQALRNLGFDEYVAPLQLYLEKYRGVRQISDPTLFQNVASCHLCFCF